MCRSVCSSFLWVKHIQTLIHPHALLMHKHLQHTPWQKRAWKIEWVKSTPFGSIRVCAFWRIARYTLFRFYYDNEKAVKEFFFRRSLRCFPFDSAHTGWIVLTEVECRQRLCVCVSLLSVSVYVCPCMLYAVHDTRCGDWNYNTQCVLLDFVRWYANNSIFMGFFFFLAMALMCSLCLTPAYKTLSLLHGHLLVRFFMWYGRQILFEWVQLSSIADAVRNIQKSFHQFHLLSKCVELFWL